MNYCSGFGFSGESFKHWAKCGLITKNKKPQLFMIKIITVSDSLILAVKGGFEPPIRFNPYDSLANCWFQPLTHFTFLLRDGKGIYIFLLEKYNP